MTELSPGTSPPPVRIPILCAGTLSIPLEWLEPAVAVQAAEEQVAADVCEQDGNETDDEDECGWATCPLAPRSRAQVDGVDQPGDEGRRLFRVPAPVAAPRDRRPVRAQDDERGKDREADDHRAVGDLVEHGGRRQPRDAVFLALD